MFLEWSCLVVKTPCWIFGTLADFKNWGRKTAFLSSGWNLSLWYCMYILSTQPADFLNFCGAGHAWNRVSYPLPGAHCICSHVPPLSGGIFAVHFGHDDALLDYFWWDVQAYLALQQNWVLIENGPVFQWNSESLIRMLFTQSNDIKSPRWMVGFHGKRTCFIPNKVRFNHHGMARSTYVNRLVNGRRLVW